MSIDFGGSSPGTSTIQVKTGCVYARPNIKLYSDARTNRRVAEGFPIVAANVVARALERETKACFISASRSYLKCELAP